MKTVMQELFDELKESTNSEQFVVDNAKLYHPNDVKQANLIISCTWHIIEKIEPLLKKEQEMIKAEFYKGYDKAVEDGKKTECTCFGRYVCRNCDNNEVLTIDLNKQL